MLTSKRAKKFRATVVNPFVKHLLDNDNQADDYQPMPHELPPNHELILNTKEVVPHNCFADSRIAQLNGLMIRGVSKVVHDSEGKGSRLYGSRFVPTI